MKHVASMFTGPIEPIEKRANLNVVGSSAGRAGVAASQADMQKLTAYLVSHSPAEVDTALVSRASQLGVGLKVRFDYSFPRDDVGNPLPMISRVAGVSVSGDAPNCAAVAERAASLMTPPEARDVEAWLAELSVIVAKRRDDEFTEGLRLEAYASRLRRYPIDVVKSVVLSRTWKFWPSWSELEQACEQLTAPRRAMLAALDRRAATAEPHERREGCEPQRERISAERANAIIREVFGRDDGGAA